MRPQREKVSLGRRGARPRQAEAARPLRDPSRLQARTDADHAVASL